MNTNKKLSTNQRKSLIRKISQVSGIAQYALQEKLSNTDILELFKILDSLLIIKPANDYNRYCQAKKTAEANAKLKEFANKKLPEYKENLDKVVEIASQIIQASNDRIDTLSKQNSKIKDYILKNGGEDEWEKIVSSFE